MENIKNDVIKILTTNFGEKTGELALRFYDEDHPEELVELAEEMMTRLVGPKSAKKQLQPIYKKYSRIRKAVKYGK